MGSQKTHKPNSAIYLRRPSESAVTVGNMDAITLEHIGELVRAHSELLAALYAVPVESVELDYNLEEMRSFYMEFFSPSQFSNIFVTPIGKGYLVAFFSTMASLRDGLIEVPDGAN